MLPGQHGKAKKLEDRLREALWLRDANRFPVPAEYHTFLVCDRLGRFKSEVEMQPFEDIQEFLICLSVEAEVREANRKV